MYGHEQNDWPLAFTVVGIIAVLTLGPALSAHWSRQDAIERDRTTLHLNRAKCGMDDQ